MPKPLLESLERLVQKSLMRVAEKAANKGDLQEGQLERAIGDLYSPASRSRFVSALLSTLRADAPKMLGARRKDIAGFERRNIRRWRRAFELLEMIIAITEEVGEANDHALRGDAQRECDYKFEALSQLHPRAILVSREILCLLRGGYPDAALSRWRSLHELTVTAMFIASQEQQIALQYLASFRFRSLRAANQLNKYAERAGMDPFTDQQIAELETECQAAEKQLGRRLKKDYDWASPADTDKNITFDAIEKSVGLDHWRPRYRWASQHTHAGHRPPDRLLGLVEAEAPVMLVGPSNSGFTDPLHMAAISLTQMATTFLFHKPNLDRLVVAEALSKLSNELGPLALKIERKTLKADRTRKEKKVRLRTSH